MAIRKFSQIPERLDHIYERKSNYYPREHIIETIHLKARIQQESIMRPILD